MTIEEIKNYLAVANTISFKLPDGNLVPAHFHVTEVGKITKHFIDCGGTERKEEVANFQLWEADDYDHRLHPEKLLSIIELSQQKLSIGNLPIEVEYQGQTIGKYGLTYVNGGFTLTNKQTDCLAKDNCGIPPQKQFVNLARTITEGGGCTSGSGCC